ncbi:asparagine synthase (glutamine-hydrolyzing) [Noviherbaspirillum sedimenti]|uniref:asparagine synthase (glutamine-hydrolyzing) n=1 Tax=Noviherbaspirillum sedimenti TaxID=2320865 RepID=A0A3A3G036_9BURK|nr:asparagine synthase (glutamine-hydrolyzing) [Noviherbaspirillum sedimenti]RJG01284.1 asparagine synthase (glutamine-hydrolyzing) [Noviherbaspirillum sedimenti]
MCGIAGFFGAGALYQKEEHPVLLKRMTDAIIYRGPDDAGYWCDREHGVGLGHRRLSIIDLSAAGHQPMQSASSRYCIVFNGEIYNHLVLRKQLESAGNVSAWRGHSDTETLLAGFDAWGIQGTIERAIGMFAIAVWDRETGTLTLVRDRIGEKPLYYGWQGRGDKAVFLFGSELKALRAHPAFENVVSRGALCLQLRHNYIPAPYSIYEGIAKLPPGSMMTVSSQRREVTVSTYWSGAQQAVAGVHDPFVGTPEAAVDELEILLKDAVRSQMMADVPLGAFLSGGVDSSTVVAQMQAQSSRPVKTFSIGFHEEGYDEAQHAKAVARHLGTDHTEWYVTARQAMDVIPCLPMVYDEPFSDSSQLPTLLVSQLARQHVTVSLSGDAGDELFCGYNRYQFAARLWTMMSAAPLSLRKLAARGLTGVSTQTWNRMAGAVARFMPQSLQFANPGDKLHKGAGVMASASLDALYLGLVSHWDDPADVVIGATEPATLLTANAPSLSSLDGIQRMMALDLLTYLPDDILAKVDRAAMSVSLETRVPFLDHRVVEFAWRLPQSYKLRDGTTKWALRQVLYRHVPKALIERPKMGFGVPIGDWLRGPLREWAEALLDESRLRREGYFKPVQIRNKWEEHLSGRRNWQYHLWDVLMFQSWFEHQSGELNRHEDNPAVLQPSKAWG